MGSAGISVIVSGIERERESEYCTIQAKQVTAWAEREGGGAWRNKTTPADQKRELRGWLRKSTHLFRVNKTHGEKEKKRRKKQKKKKGAFLWGKPQQPRFFTAWVVFGVCVLNSPFNNLLRDSRQNSHVLGEKRGRTAHEKSTPSFICDAPSSIWHSFFTLDLLPSIKMTSAGQTYTLWLHQHDSLPGFAASMVIHVKRKKKKKLTHGFTQRVQTIMTGHFC